MQPSVSALTPFQNRRYLAYWLTGLSANFGWLIQLVGASWLMTSIGGTPDMVALVQTALAVPTMMFALVAGAMADNFGRRTMVLWSQTFLLAVSTVLAFGAYLGILTPWLLLVLTFLIGSGKALNNPGWQTMVVEFVTKDQMPAAISLNSVGFNIARTVGPAIGGAIVATVGVFAAFVVNAVSNVGVILVFLRWQGAKRDGDLPPEPIGAAMVAGMRYVAMSPHIMFVMARATIFNIAAISLLALMPLVARDLLSGGARTYGLLLGAFGAGAIVGAFLTGPLRAAMTLEGRTRVGFASYAASLCVVAMSTHVVVTMLAISFAGASWLLTLSTFNTTVQMSSPRWVVSRCHALYQTASFAGNAVGSLIWGQIAGYHGTSLSIGFSAVALLAGVALGRLLPLQELDTLGFDPHDRWQSPDIKLDIVPRSGPIRTTVEYIIRDSDVVTFLQVMAERRRTRKRDGASKWTLLRDVERPDHWIESYETPTWVDTVRHHHRRTHADKMIGNQLRSLHRGAEPPLARRHLMRRGGWSTSEIEHAIDTLPEH